jgi:hypothetical protein
LLLITDSQSPPLQLFASTSKLLARSSCIMA